MGPEDAITMPKSKGSESATELIKNVLSRPRRFITVNPPADGVAEGDFADQVRHMFSRLDTEDSPSLLWIPLAIATALLSIFLVGIIRAGDVPTSWIELLSVPYAAPVFTPVVIVATGLWMIFKYVRIPVWNHGEPIEMFVSTTGSDGVKLGFVDALGTLENYIRDFGETGATTSEELGSVAELLDLQTVTSGWKYYVMEMKATEKRGFDNFLLPPKAMDAETRPDESSIAPMCKFGEMLSECEFPVFIQLVAVPQTKGQDIRNRKQMTICACNDTPLWKNYLWGSRGSKKASSTDQAQSNTKHNPATLSGGDSHRYECIQEMGDAKTFEISVRAIAVQPEQTTTHEIEQVFQDIASTLDATRTSRVDITYKSFEVSDTKDSLLGTKTRATKRILKRIDNGEYSVRPATKPRWELRSQKHRLRPLRTWGHTVTTVDRFAGYTPTVPNPSEEFIQHTNAVDRDQQIPGGPTADTQDPLWADDLEPAVETTSEQDADTDDD
jgi:hypothetical protein